MPRFDRSHTDDLAEYIRLSPTPYHACAVAGERLEAAGFRRLDEADAWPREPGGYYAVRDGSIIAWRQNGEVDAFRVFGAHTDTPTLKVKPRPDTGSGGWKQVACEVYGGVPRDTWLDRDLGVAGRLVMRDGSHVLVHVDRPVLRVPRLAIHLDRKVNEEGQKLNPQTQFTPVWGLGEPREGEFLEFAAAEAGVDAKDVLGFDLFTAACDRPSYLGKDGELFAAWRLDNLLSTHAGLAALIAAEDTEQVPVLVSFNYEEIGSMTYSAAQSPFLESVLRRVAGGDFERFARIAAASRMMSADTGNALHPNYAERHEPGHHPMPNGGPMIKVSANQRYATGAEEQAVFTRAAERAGIPWQHYVSRNDIPGGTTIGPISGTRLGVLTVDVGAPILSMHSSRELCGADDPAYLADLALGLYTCELLPVGWSHGRDHHHGDACGAVNVPGRQC